jgi:hypothetical protein
MRARQAGLRSLHCHRPPDPETPRRIQVARQIVAERCKIEAVAERLNTKVPVVCAMLGGGALRRECLQQHGRTPAVLLGA